ncbi:facilitated trehalose transporter Tret1-like [Sitodiplosis mosellana]|uniref:facilitated trehalose transporter Tret1-like n=1 Tax=Sitodiplosis mosellana TaxID=263140 RepID=UPI002444A7DE|nr:facilitated trehalose transporter Tret1-like [Sitodiplosis mosellana]
MRNVDPKTMQQSNAKFQYLAAGFVNLLSVGYGVTCGWASPNIILLTTNETPLPSGKITMDEASWIASLLCVGGLIGNIFFGYITNRFGRKLPLIFISIPTVISWLLILFAQNVYYLFASRLLNGFVGGCVFCCCPLYLNEIACDRVRGTLGSTLVLIANMGILLAFVLGNFCNFYTTPKVIIALTIVFEISFCFFPESPKFLLKQNRISDTEKSISFYQNISTTDKEALQFEMDKLRNALSGTKNDGSSNQESSWTDFITERIARKAITIGIVLASLNQFCGCFAMLQYTANIFQEAGSSMSPNMSTIIVAVIQFLGSYVATNLVDRAGRKFLFIVSTVGTAMGLITMEVYMMLKTWGYDVESYSWIPIASFSFVIFIANWAVLTLPFPVIAELMPENLKDFGVSFCMTLLWSCAFIIIKYLPTLTETLGFHGCMFLFAGVCYRVQCSSLYLCQRQRERSESLEQIEDQECDQDALLSTLGPLDISEQSNEEDEGLDDDDKAKLKLQPQIEFIVDEIKMENDLFLEMLEVYINSILYVREVYPAAIFTRRRVYDENEDKKELDIELYIIQFEEELRRGLIQLEQMAKNLKRLNTDCCGFRIHLETTDSSYVDIVNKENSKSETTLAACYLGKFDSFTEDYQSDSDSSASVSSSESDHSDNYSDYNDECDDISPTPLLLFTLSTIGAASGFIVLALFVLVESHGVDVEGFRWIPLVGFSIAIFSSSLAILNLPYVIISEIMPEHIKDFAISFSLSVLWASTFIVVKFLPHLTETIGFPATMFIFALMCVLGGIFVVFFVPETKGKSYEEIMSSLREM